MCVVGEWRLEEDKKLLEREYSRMPKVNELERRIEQLKAENLEFAREITQRKEEINELRLSLDEAKKRHEAKKRELKEHMDTVSSYKNEYVLVHTMPTQIAKESDRINDEIKWDQDRDRETRFRETLLLLISSYLCSEINKQRAKIERDIEQMAQQLADAEREQEEAQTKKQELADHVNEQRLLGFEREKEFNEMSKQFEFEREKEVVLQSEK